MFSKKRTAYIAIASGRGFRIASLVFCLCCITACSKTAKTERLHQSQSQVLAASPVSTPSPSPKPRNLSFAPPVKFQGKTVYKAEVPNNDRVIALTFDDGPWKDTSVQM